MAKHAIALRRFTDAATGTRYPKDAVLKNLTAGQFANFEAAGLVRQATAKEAASESAPKPEPAPPSHERAISTPPPAPKPKRVSKPRTARKKVS